MKRRRFSVEDLTREYLEREVDSRMVEVISEQLHGESSVLDVACGSGLYGPYLKAEVPVVYGIDHDSALCDAATLAPVSSLDHPARLLAAARIGAARLIDNIPVGPPR